MCFMSQLERSNQEREAIHVPVGFRFDPTDEELVCSYLAKKLTHQPLSSPIIKEIGLQELYISPPWDLPGMNLFQEHERYFFTPWNANLHDECEWVRISRFGFWKPCGVHVPVYDSTGKEIAVKNVLVFYYAKSRESVKETRWVMEEFRLPGSMRSSMGERGIFKVDWVLCRVQLRRATSVFKVDDWDKDHEEKQ